MLFLLCPRYHHTWFELHTELHKPDPFKHFHPNMKTIHVVLNKMLCPDICVCVCEGGGVWWFSPRKKENLACKISHLNNFGLKFGLFIIL